MIEISAKVSSLCFQYSVAVKHAKEDIERLQKKVKDIEDVLDHLRRLLERSDNVRVPVSRELGASLQACLGQLQKLEKQLKPGKSHEFIRYSGARALEEEKACAICRRRVRAPKDTIHLYRDNLLL